MALAVILNLIKPQNGTLIPLSGLMAPTPLASTQQIARDVNQIRQREHFESRFREIVLCATAVHGESELAPNQALPATGHQRRFEPRNPTRPYGNPKPCERMFEIPVLGFASLKKGRSKAHRTNGRSSPTTATRSSCHHSTLKVAISTTQSHFFVSDCK